MLELIIIVLLVLWLVGYFGPGRYRRFPRTGSFVHLLLLIVLVLIVVRVLQ